MESIDQFLEMDILNQSTTFANLHHLQLQSNPHTHRSSHETQSQTPALPATVEGELDTAGMSFADMFRQYLAPEVAKLPSSTGVPPLQTAPAPSNSLGNPQEFYSATDSLPPSAFMPTIPGSPIGGFSPASENSGDHSGQFGSLSPIGYGDLDLLAESDMGAESWAIDPSFFGDEQQQQAVVDPIVVPFTAPVVDPPQPLVNQQVNAANLATFAAPPRPSSRRQPSVVEEEENEDDDMEGDSDENSEASSSRNTTTKLSIKKTKAQQKLAKTSVAGFATATLHATSARSTLPPVPEWTDKPDPETYKKLNSKEKRQLRNKISARNFRHRRKEYITTLEEEISSRDTIIAQLRDEVGVIRGENKDLRGEVSMLKAKWDEMMEKMASFTIPSAGPSTASTSSFSLPASVGLARSSSAGSDDWALDTDVTPRMHHTPLANLAAVNLPNPPVASTSGGSRRGTRSGGIAKPNLTKDAAPGLKRGTGSWTTAGMGGGYTSVHTTLLPEFNVSFKPSLPLFPTSAAPSSGNFNPTLNSLTPSQLAELAQSTSHLPNMSSLSTFDDFFASNPLSLKGSNVEAYRGQLYGKLAHNMAGANVNSNSPPNTLGFKPTFFSATSPRASPSSLIESLSQKPSSRTSTSTSFPSTLEDQEQAQALQIRHVASLATSTLFSKMTSAFLSAFAGDSTVGNRNAVGLMDPSKVLSVMQGRARLEVVEQPMEERVEALGLGLRGMEISPVVNTPTPLPSEAAQEVKVEGFEEVCKKWSRA